MHYVRVEFLQLRGEGNGVAARHLGDSSSLLAGRLLTNEDVAGSNELALASLSKALGCADEHFLNLHGTSRENAQELTNLECNLGEQATSASTEEAATSLGNKDFVEGNVTHLLECIEGTDDLETGVLECLGGASNSVARAVAAVGVVDLADDSTVLRVLIIISIEKAVLCGDEAATRLENTVKLSEGALTVSGVQGSLEVVNGIEGVIADIDGVEVVEEEIAVTDTGLSIVATRTLNMLASDVHTSNAGLGVSPDGTHGTTNTTADIENALALDITELSSEPVLVAEDGMLE